MTHRRRSTKLLASLFAFSLLAAACGDDDEDPAAGGEGTEEETPATEGSGGGGGDLVLGAEQEPECADWISICSGSSWGFWAMQVHTMPRSFDIEQVDGEWEYVPSNLLTGEPELVEEPEQVVTYSINPDAVWSDGEPITCQDYVYTHDQVANGTDIYDTTGYRDIESVECTDPQTPVVTFATPYAGWKALFGGQFGILPSHILELSLIHI